MEITVSVTDVTKKYLFRQYVGEGSLGPAEFELSVTLPDMSPVLEIDSKRYLVNVQDIVKAIAKQVI